MAARRAPVAPGHDADELEAAVAAPHCHWSARVAMATAVHKVVAPAGADHVAADVEVGGDAAEEAEALRVAGDRQLHPLQHSREVRGICTATGSARSAMFRVTSVRCTYHTLPCSSHVTCMHLPYSTLLEPRDLRALTVLYLARAT